MSDYPEELSGQVDGEVTLSGIATDFKAGAAIVLDTGGSVLLDGVHYWSAGQRGTRVTVSGILRHLSGSEQKQQPLHRQIVTGERWWLEEPKVLDQP